VIIKDLSRALLASDHFRDSEFLGLHDIGIAEMKLTQISARMNVCRRLEARKF
jgi:hypothetical protein